MIHTSRISRMRPERCRTGRIAIRDGSNLAFVTDIPKQRGAHQRWAKIRAALGILRLRLPSTYVRLLTSSEELLAGHRNDG
ncbi:hypothetical protein BJS_09004 [Bradyrhizobium japonicum SEMIA 5079]|nr:hypothetical protein BJS_09006 [Bradyrhizobium japonicum SEMIA 5079]AHY52623.1 hypothetical protein BJS_09004 [Bradyrhizobium japonicum SEMIA 5079]